MKTVEEISDKMFQIIAEAKGKKKYTPRQLQKFAMNLFGKEADRKACKEAVKLLIESSRCTYSMYGGVNYVEISDQSAK